MAGLLRPRGGANPSSSSGTDGVQRNSGSGSSGVRMMPSEAPRASLAGAYDFGPDKQSASTALAATAGASPFSGTGDAAAAAYAAAIAGPLARQRGERGESGVWPDHDPPRLPFRHQRGRQSGAGPAEAADGAREASSPAPDTLHGDWWDAAGRLSVHGSAFASDMSDEDCEVREGMVVAHSLICSHRSEGSEGSEWATWCNRAGCIRGLRVTGSPVCVHGSWFSDSCTGKKALFLCLFFFLVWLTTGCYGVSAPLLELALRMLRM